MDCAGERETEEESVEDWAAVGEVSGFVDGRMDEASVEEDWPVDREAEEEDTEEEGRVVGQNTEDWLLERRVAEGLISGW